MSRVLLFVQAGDARPKCVKQFGSDRARGLQYLGHLVRPDIGTWLYWLVECENADAGREAIASGRTELRSGFGGNGSLLVGRILASGGRHA
jgi:hypothetical protein